MQDIKETNLYFLLRKRAKRLRLLGYSILFCIGILLMGSIFIFTFAGKITSSDFVEKDYKKELEENLKKLKSDIEKEQKELHELLKQAIKKDDIEERRKIDLMVTDFKESLRHSDIKIIVVKNIHAHLPSEPLEYAHPGEIIRKLDKILTVYYLSIYRDHEVIEGFFKEFKEVHKKYTENHSRNEKERLKFYQQYSQDINNKKRVILRLQKISDEITHDTVKGLYSAKFQEVKQNLNNTKLIHTNITRFGTIILLLFLVKILINLYRYCVRLSAFYDAHADSEILLKSNVNPDFYSTFIKALLPENYDFESAPKAPSDEALELTKLIVANKNKK